MAARLERIFGIAKQFLNKTALRELFFSENHHQISAAFHLRFGVHFGDIFQFFLHFFEQFITQFFVGDGASPENDGDFNFGTAFDEFSGGIDFEIEIVVVDIGSQPDTLILDGMLFFSGVFFLFALFIAEFAVIHNSADGWIGLGSDFHQIEFDFFREFQSLLRRDDADLFTLFIDKSDVGGFDLLIDSRPLF